MKASYRIIILLLIGSLLSGCTPNDNIDPDDPNVYSEQAYPGSTGEIVQITMSGETITCEKINEEYIFQGDILLQSPTKGAVYAEGNLWPDNIVYYTINSNLPNKERVTQAIEYYHTNTNLTFIQRTNQPNYIDFIYDADGCSSYLGMIGGRQPIRLADWGIKGNVIHEIGHAIGLLHEHSKVGRDQYVTINEENIEEGKQHNFTEYKSSNPNTDGFDFESIMLYSSYAFSKNGQPTIVRKNGKVFNAQRSRLSEDDLEIIDELYPGKPTVVTLSITDITENSAISGGNITRDGGSPVTARGVCWGTSENPTTSNSLTIDGTGTGTYTSNITDLSLNTTYYVRAYATNSEGTAYGEQKSFKTNQDEDEEGSTFVDPRDGDPYETVTIGEQVWMAENLAYLPAVSAPTSRSSTELHYYVYDYDGTDVAAAKVTANYTTYGVLYNWPAALTACPDGWRLPSDEEWKQLEIYLGMSWIDADNNSWRGTDEGGKLKEAGISHWASPNTGATNSSGFTALAGGLLGVESAFENIGSSGYWWSSTDEDERSAWYRILSYNNSLVCRHRYSDAIGLSVRCIQGNQGNIVLYVTTGDVSDISTTTATCGSNVRVHGADAVTARGVCWSTSENPTTSNSITTDGTSVGDFISNLTGLSPNTTYYIRAYATISERTYYGEQKSFTTFSEKSYGSFTDSRDGNQYETITIGEQVWMAENLAYLPSVVGPATGSMETAYYYVYGYDGTDVEDAKAYLYHDPRTEPYSTYGVLYNWPAALTACPDGWHLPSDDEWKQLEIYLGMSEEEADETTGRSTDGDEGGKLKEAGTSHWNTPNTGATNESGFTALPGGYCPNNGYFFNIGALGYWWSSTSFGSTAWYRSLSSSRSSITRDDTYKDHGYSVRCLQD